MIKRMQMLSGAALGAVAMLGSCSGGGAVVAMEPGEWEWSIRVTNVRADNLPPEMREEMNRMRTNETRTARACMTVSADVVRIQNLRFTVPTPGGPAAGCRIAELSMEGGRIRGEMSCEGMPAPGGLLGGAGTMSISSEMNGTYAARSLNVTGRGEMRIGERGASAEMRITGRRIGACPAPRPYTPPPTVMVPRTMPETYAPPPPSGNMVDNGM